MLVVKLHSACYGLAEGEACEQHTAREREKGTEHFLPEVSVLVWESLAQIGSVTYLATRECLDLISGKVSDMVTVEIEAGLLLRED